MAMNTITNPADLQKIKAELKEASGSMTRVEAERDLQKEIKKNLVTKFGIPPKIAGKLIKIYHKQNYQEVLDEQEELNIAYESIVKNKAQGGLTND